MLSFVDVEGVRLQVHGHRPQAPVSLAHFREWVFKDGVRWTLFFKDSSGYLLRFPTWADFHLSLDGRVASCWPCLGVNASSVDHLFLNQVMPLALSLHGKLVFHASAVEVNQRAVAFMAPAGRGKSTLAASFAASGYRFLSDDGLDLRIAEDQIEVRPSHPSIRLWRDSEEALVANHALRAPPVQYSSKARFLAGDKLRFCPVPLPLHRIYFLGDTHVSRPEIEPLSPSRVVEELMRNSFLLDIDEKTVLAAHFDELVQLAGKKLYFWLNYPRKYQLLPEIRQAIIEHAGQSTL